MASHWLRVLGALAAGAGVMGVLFLLTLFSEDRPLWGVNPDLQIAAAGVLAAIAGLSVYAGMRSRSMTGMALGAGLGTAGFAVVLLGGMAFVATLSAGGASYDGWQAGTNFDEAWNETTAEEALEAQGFNVTSAGPDGLTATGGDGVTIRIDTHDDQDRPASQATFWFSVMFDVDGGRVDDCSEARRQAQADRPALEARFQEILSQLESSAGWDPVGEPVWEARIAVA